MIPIDIIGLKNFRIFDYENGFLEEITSINILTGANNSGKSSIIKFLQMLKNSIKENQVPFVLDLTQQEHLLGDFDNVLFNKENRDIVISLPFMFLGIKNIYISLLFTIPSIKNVYQAKLRKIDVIDREDNEVMFSFTYREATDIEKETYQDDFQSKLHDYEQNKKNQSQQKIDDNSSNIFFFPPTKNPLIGYIDWNIRVDKLKTYLSELFKFYKVYLENKSNRKFLENADKKFENSWLMPSALINSFKKEIDINTWSDFINIEIKDKKTISGKEFVGEGDFETEDFFYPPLEIEDLLHDKALKILKNNLIWESSENNDTKYSVIENCFKSSWKTLIQRISTINYLSTIKEENSRIYNATNNSPFINLLKDYNSNEPKHKRFINKYLKAFEIGKKISVNYTLKYQLISVSVTTLENTERELVDFGYGIKQLILILIQISVLAEKNKRTLEDYDEDGEFMYDYYIPSMLLLEEPETNLHPKWQSLLAELFVESNKEFNIQFMIETHSEYLIRKFQTLVADNKINGENIKIFYLRHPQSVTHDKKQVSSIHIQQDGSINYHIFEGGFFDQNDNLELSLLNIQRDRFLKEFNNLKKNKEENENKITELEQKIDTFTSKLDIEVYKTIINQRFDTLKLSPISIKYLSSGQLLLHTINENSDFSPVIIQYGRTIENELKDIFIAIGITDAKKLMLGRFQGALEKYKTGTTIQSTFSISELSLLPTELSNRFINPKQLKIELLNDIREKRNDAGHSGQTKTKQEATDYILKVNDFIDKWISEKK